MPPRQLGLHAAAATGHYLLSVLHQEAGDTRKAEASTLRAAAAGRTADDATRAHQLANTARCLLELETEIGRSRDLIREADAIASSARLGAVRAALGARAAASMGRRGRDGDRIHRAARSALARKDEDRWREYKCLTWLAMLEAGAGPLSTKCRRAAPS